MRRVSRPSPIEILAFALAAGSGALVVTHSDSRALPFTLLACALAASHLSRHAQSFAAALAAATMFGWAVVCHADVSTTALLMATGAAGALVGHALGQRVQSDVGRITQQIFTIALAQACVCLALTEHAATQNFAPLLVLYAVVPAVLQLASERRLFVSTVAAQPLVAVSLPLFFGYQYSYLLLSWFFLPVVALFGTSLGWYGRSLLPKSKKPRFDRAPTSPAF